MTNILGHSPRQFEMLIPMIGRDEKPLRDWKDSDQPGQKLEDNFSSREVLRLMNKQPVWDKKKE